MKRKKRTTRTPEEQAAYDERTRRIEEYLKARGVPTGSDAASYDERTRRIQERIAYHQAKLAEERAARASGDA